MNKNSKLASDMAVDLHAGLGWIISLMIILALGMLIYLG